MLSLILGITGSLFKLFGYFILAFGAGDEHLKFLLYLIGTILMLITAVSKKSTYFILLETVLLAGFGSILFGFGRVLQIAIPLLLSSQVLIYYLLSNRFKDLNLMIGVFGIAILSCSFAVDGNLIYLLGSILISYYSYYLYKEGRELAWIWLILNIIFIFISGYEFSLEYFA